MSHLRGNFIMLIPLQVSDTLANVFAELNVVIYIYYTFTFKFNETLLPVLVNTNTQS